MEKDKQVFVDSNYFVAFFNVKDNLHQNAISWAKKLESGKITIIISNFIFLEVVTVLAQRVGKETSVRVGRYLSEDPKIKIIHIDTILQDDTWHIFRKIKDKNIGFVDCSILAVLQAEYMAELLTFDETDFKKLRKNYRFNLFK
ncbi:MAG: PIN domain-containing protein [Patescibacteria group bacterium]